MKVLLFGATGNVGKAIANELKQKGYKTTAVIRNKEKAKTLKSIVNEIIIANAANTKEITNICDGFDIIISSLGKSVSPSDKSKASFYEVDYSINMNILKEAIKNNVQKFIYISAFHSEKYTHLEYFKVHHAFSEQVISSGLNYSIIKPPAIFSAFIEMIEMARNGKLINIGKGDKKTNPIFEGDLAKIVTESIQQTNSIIEAGGKYIYTRKQLNEIIQQTVAPNKSLKNIPLVIIKLFLPIVRITDKNTYNKFKFFLEVMQHDTIAPLKGNMSFEDYINMKNRTNNPQSKF